MFYNFEEDSLRHCTPFDFTLIAARIHKGSVEFLLFHPDQRPSNVQLKYDDYSPLVGEHFAGSGLGQVSRILSRNFIPSTSGDRDIRP